VTLSSGSHRLLLRIDGGEWRTAANTPAVDDDLGGKAGLLVDVASPSSIASGMRTLLEDDSLRSILAQSGRQRALDEYQLEEVAARYERVLAKAREEQTN